MEDGKRLYMSSAGAHTEMGVFRRGCGASLMPAASVIGNNADNHESGAESLP